MSNFRDRFYDKNDILVAVLIILIAAAVIALKIDNIMSYPETLISTETSQESRGAGEDVNVEIESEATINQVAVKLQNAGVISSSSDFLEEVKGEEAEGVVVEIVPGEYTFTKGMSTDEILETLSGK